MSPHKSPMVTSDNYQIMSTCQKIVLPIKNQSQCQHHELCRK